MSSTGSCNFTQLDKNVLENGGMTYTSGDVVAENPKQISFGRKRKRCKWILIGVIIALGITCICLGIVLMLKTGKKPKPTSPKSPENVCYTAQCLKVASILKQDMNASVDPCEQFMKFSCDGWVKNNPIGQGEDEYGSMFALSNKNYKILRFLIEDLGQYPTNNPMLKVKNYYFSCMNENAIEQHSLQDFQLFLGRLGKWPVLDSNWNGTWHWVDELARFQSEIFVEAPLIYLNVMVNPKDTKEYLFQVSVKPQTHAKEKALFVCVHIIVSDRYIY